MQPLQKFEAISTVWYSKQAMGHNSLQKIVPDLFKTAGINGHFTNHSLRATAATSLYEQGMDEQLIMERTGHRSVEGKQKQSFLMSGIYSCWRQDFTTFVICTRL